MRANGLLIRRMREEQGLSLRDLAGRSGVHFASVSRVEVGARNPRARTLKKIADGLGVAITDIASHDPVAGA